MIKIYHNPLCSKSRQTLALLEEQGHDAEIILYLKDAPNKGQIAALKTKLVLNSYRDMMRKGESVYKELNLKTADEAALLDAMAKHPILIERPIVETDKAARIGRPPEQVLEILS